MSRGDPQMVFHRLVVSLPRTDAHAVSAHKEPTGEARDGPNEWARPRFEGASTSGALLCSLSFRPLLRLEPVP